MGKALGAGRAGMIGANEYERIGGSFHYALGTLAELLLINELLTFCRLPERHDETPMRDRIDAALARLSSDRRRRMLRREVLNIEQAVREAA